MKMNVIAAVVIFALGAIAGHATSLSYQVSDAAISAQVSPLDMMLKAGELPVQVADAI
jgi:hypothetical protein